MKIYGDYTFILDKLNIQTNSQVKVFQNGTKVVEFADEFLEEQRAASPDRVSISTEGIDYMRDKLSDLGLGKDISQLTEGESFWKISDKGLSLMDGVCREYILQRLDFNGTNGVSSRLYGELEKRYQEELSGKDKRDAASYAESLAGAYASMYKNIADGYDNGTREVWTLDSSTGDDFNGVEFVIDGRAVRYRKLTEEEELGRLRESFDRLVEDVSKKLAKEEASVALKEKNDGDGAESEEGLDGESDFWKMAGIVKDLMKELDRLISELETMFAEKEPEPENIGGRIMSEARSHGEATAARGKQQAQLANYRKMSRMALNVQSILGNLGA